jgi:(p)ppGpp synthase/HD superfamily hydrolase
MMHLNLMAKNTALIERARAFAREKHASHFRKYTNLPYYTHLENVADLVASVTSDEEVIAAALLHDSLEDTDVTFSELVLHFGNRVADLVNEVTDVSTKADGNRAKRKGIDRDHLANASADGATVKLADLIDNSRDIEKHDARFAKMYLAEKRALLEVLKAGNSTLWDLANKVVA